MLMVCACVFVVTLVILLPMACAMRARHDIPIYFIPIYRRSCFLQCFQCYLIAFTSQYMPQCSHGSLSFLFFCIAFVYPFRFALFLELLYG